MNVNAWMWWLGGAGLALTALLTPLAMRLAWRVGAVDGGGHRSTHTRPIPLLGGLAVAVPFLLFCALVGLGSPFLVRHWEWVWRLNSRLLTPLFSLAGLRHELGVLGLGGVAMLALGAIDDVRPLRARTKLAVELLIAVCVVASGQTMKGVDLPFFGEVQFVPVVGMAISVLWLVGLTNAFNIIDGVDGLASGTALISAVGLAALASAMDNTLVVLPAAVLAGSLGAFLFFNFPPGRVFLGDTGSLFLGFTLAGLGLIGGHKSQTTVFVVAPVLILGFPIMESTVSMLRRFLRGRPIFAADARHTHHRLAGADRL